MKLFFRRSNVLPKNVLLPKRVAVLGTLAAFSALTMLPTRAFSRPAMRAQTSNAGAGLSFDITARLVALQHGQPSDMPAQTFDARVFLKGSNARVETEVGDRPAVYLLTPPYLTKLLPNAKAGARWKVSRKVTFPGAGGAGLGNDLQTLMRDPGALRAALRRSGARMAGNATLNGTPVEIYNAANFMGGGQKLTAWLRRSDALPVRAQLISKTLSSTLSWSNYRRVALPDSLFHAPAGYNVRNSTGQPSF